MHKYDIGTHSAVIIDDKGNIVRSFYNKDFDTIEAMRAACLNAWQELVDRDTIDGFSPKHDGRHRLHKLQINIDIEGHKQAILFPQGDDGNFLAGYRIAGPKAWGTRQRIVEMRIDDSDLVHYIQNYAPHLISKLKR
jgi:hypothetical protein